MYLGSQTIRTVGKNVTGIRSWEKALFDPWEGPLPLTGTDAGSFSPLNKSPHDLIMFSNDVMMPVKFKFGENKRVDGLTAWKFNPDNSLMLNSTENEDNAFFYNGVHGTLNITSVLGVPAFASKGHYLDIDYNSKMTPILKDKKGKVIKADRGKDDLFVVVEPWTGATMQAALRLMISFRIKKDFLFENFPEDSYFLPYAYIRKEFQLSSKQITDGLGALRMALNAVLGIRIVGYGVGALLMIGGGLLLFWAWKIKKNEGLAGYTKVEDIQPSAELEKKVPMLNETDQIAFEATKENISED